MEAVERVHPAGWDFTLEAPSRNRTWYEERGYEPYSATLFAASCGRSDVVVDIGAHMGFYSLVAREANPDARIVAVEASPDNAEVLNRNLRGSGEVVSAAFSDRPGSVAFYLAEASDNGGLTGHPLSPTVRTVEVPAITGEDLAIAPGSRVTIKIDVEGHEISALRGLEGVIREASAVSLFLEFNPKCIVMADNDADELVGWIRDHGFRIFVLDETALDWHELPSDSRWEDYVDALGYTNFYCAPAESTVTMSAVMHAGGLGGAERSQAELAAAMVARGHLVHAIVPRPDTGSLALLRSAGAAVTVVEPFPWWMQHSDAMAESAIDWAAHLVNHQIVEVLERRRPDVVLSASSVIPQGAVAACQLGLPHVWYLREFGDVDHGLELPVAADELGRLISSLSDVVLTNSAAVRDHFFGTNSEHAAIVVPSIPHVGEIQPRPVAARRWSVGVIGSFNPGKGHEDALRAVALLRADGVDVPLVFVGTGTPEDRARLEGLARELAVEDIVDMPGPIEDPSTIYSLFDAVAVTSKSEAFGRVPFEATKAGLPVVYAAAGGIAEYMIPDTTGLGYPPGDHAALAAGIRALRASAADTLRLVDNARIILLDEEATEARVSTFIDALVTARSGSSWNTLRTVTRWLATSAVAAEGSEERLVHQLAHLTSAHSELEAGNQGLAAAHADLQEQYGALVVGNHGLAAAHDALRAEHDKLVRTTWKLAEEHDALLAQRSALSADASAEEAEIQRLRATEAELQGMLGSRTWRYTSPLRAVLGRLRRR